MKVTNPGKSKIHWALKYGGYDMSIPLGVTVHALMRECVGNWQTPEESHEKIDSLLKNHGIESARFKVRGQTRTLYYSNAGDTYKTTIMRWDWRDGLQRRVIWMVGCWGDIAEKYPEVVQ